MLHDGENLNAAPRASVVAYGIHEGGRGSFSKSMSASDSLFSGG
jgi:hypothetical protein